MNFNKLNLMAMSILAISVIQGLAHAAELTPLEQLGKALFFDTRLSQPAGQSCASCHDPSNGFSAPAKTGPVSKGAAPGKFGNRNAPTMAYSAFSPPFHFDKKDKLYLGGQFLDGRAATLAEQLAGPLTNPVEMGNPDIASVVTKVREAGYAARFKRVFGQSELDNEQSGFEQIRQAILAYEQSREVNAFSSKYDLYLAGKLALSDSELRGMKIFEDENKGNCAACHPHKSGNGDNRALFTDFSYDNLGVPANKANPFYRMNKTINPNGQAYTDKGLGVTTDDGAQDGKFKVPTLRNIARTAPYMHNGVFNTLREVIDFYNTRDVDSKWPSPEVSANVNTDELGDLKLSKQEIEHLINFLHTLTDGYPWPQMAKQP